MSQLLIRCGRVFDGERLRPEPDLCIEVRAGRIASIGPARDGQAAITTIDARDYTVLPGLIDAHFHAVSASLDVAAIDRMHPSHRALGAREHLEAALRRGFTTVRDAGGADIGLVRATAEGLIDGPRLLIAGKALSQTGGHGDMRPGESVQLCGCGYSGALSAVVDGADAMREKVRDQLRQGANHIKLFVSGGVLSPTDPIWMDQFTDLEIRAAVEEAATRRTYVMAHAHTASAVIRCARNGVRSIEHGTLMDRESAAVAAGAGAFVVPTMAIIESLRQTPLGLPPAALEKLAAIGDHAAAAVAHCRAAGVKVGLGTDLFGALRDQQSREFEVRGRHEASLDVLRSATSVNAELIGLQAEVGTLRPGAAADIIAVSGNPVADVAVLADPQRTLKLVVHDGRVIVNHIARSSP
jgi:imidazolonepropionase-like amidohydrolase